MTLEDLLAREAIRHTMALYNNNGDSGNYANHVNVFHPDAEMVVHQNKILRGVQEIIAALQAGAESRGAKEPGNFQRHHLTTSFIELTSPTTGRGRQDIIIVTELGLDHTGMYEDEFTEHEGRWLIKRRQATMLWARPDSRFVRWLGAPKQG